MSTRLPRYPCPYCKTVHTAASTVTDAEHDCAPSDGDVTICFACAAICLFVIKGGRTSLRKPTPVEGDELRRDPEIARVRVALIQTARDNGWELK